VKVLKRKRPRRTRLLVVTFVVATGVVLPAVGVASAGVVGADTHATGFYLDLGGSASVGVQPTVADPRGQRTPDGYSNDLVAFEAQRGVSLQLTELGCPGETTAAMINGGDHCYSSPSSQFSEALTFLRSHQSENGVVTIDIGFNDVRHCFHRGVVDETCVENQIDGLRQQLPTILTGLRNVSGPGVTFVGLGHYDPFLADALNGPGGQQFARETATAINSLNEALRSVYTNADVAMANVGTAFESHNVARVNMVGKGMVAENVANTCELTWMCEAPPFGPNLHPNDAGYAAIAVAIESQLKYPW
jgi:lysophospholipase L1-like esterase